MRIVKKIKLIINKSERETFDFWLRRCKTLYNIALDEKKYYYQATGKSLSLYDQKKELVDLKVFDKSWKDVPNKSLQEVIFRLDKAYKSFFRGNGFPKYKNNDTFNSIEFVKTDVKIKDNLVYLPKLKDGIKGTEEFPLNYSSARLVKENGDYFLTFVCETTIIKQTNNSEVVGCDLGLKTLMTDSNGFEVKRFSTKLISKYQNRINKLNNSLSKKKKGSNRRKKVKKQLNKTYLRLKNTRLDYLHKVSTSYIKQVKEDIIAIGDLNVKELSKSDGSKKQRNISRSYSTSSIKLYVDLLKYKSVKNGKELHIVREEYTSKTCSCCGVVKHDLKISDRVFNCAGCGLSVPRDENGATNIRKVFLGTFNPIGIDIEEVKRRHDLLKKRSVRATNEKLVCSI